MQSPPLLRAIQTKYYGPTNHRGSRIRITDLREIIAGPLWISYDYEHNNAHEGAQAHLEAMGWTFTHLAEAPGGEILLLTPDFRRDTWSATA